MVAVLYGRKLNDRRPRQQILNRDGKVIVKQVHKALQAHQPGAPDIFSLASISDGFKGLLKALNKIGDVKCPTFIIACICIKPAEIRIAVVYRFLKYLIKRRGHGHRRRKCRLQCRFIGSQLHVLRWYKRIKYKRGNEVLARSENLQIRYTLH